jgi:hypothetical protein
MELNKLNRPDWPKYEDLSEQLKELICNGCGGKGSIVTPPHAIFFETSCNHHDYGYFKGGTKVDRKHCDLKLREAMYKDCKKLPWYKKLRYLPWCELYYRAVRMFGHKFFCYTD